MARHSLILRRRARTRLLKRSQQKTKKQSTTVEGFALPVMLLVCAFFFSGWSYLFTINARAVQGQTVRDLERKISQLERDNTQLRITYAELTSLYGIENAQEDLKLVNVQDAQFVEEEGPLALK